MCRNINRCWVLRDNRLLPPALRCSLWATRHSPPTRIDTGWASALRSIRAHSIIRGLLSPRIGHTHIGMVRTGRAVTTIARRAVKRRAARKNRRVDSVGRWKVGRYSLVSSTCQVQKPMSRPSSIRLDLSGLFLYCRGGSKRNDFG